MGFWVGLGMRALYMWKFEMLYNLQWGDLYNVVYGFASSIVCYVTYLLLKYFMDKYD